MTRAQSHVVGVALLLGITTAALGGLTVAVGDVLEADTAGLDADRVASDLDAAFRPVAVTGRHTGTVSFLDGRLRSVERTVRLVNDSGTVAQLSADGVVYRAEPAVRVAWLFGAVVRGQPGNAGLATEPPLAVGGREVVIGVPTVNASFDVSGDGGQTVGVHTRVRHERRSLGTDTWRLAVETTTPAAWERWFRDRGVTNVSRRDYDDDGTVSVVAGFPGDRRATLVVHRVDVEVVVRGA